MKALRNQEGQILYRQGTDMYSIGIPRTYVNGRAQ